MQRGGAADRDAGAGARHPPPPESVRAGHPGLHRGTADGWTAAEQTDAILVHLMFYTNVFMKFLEPSPNYPVI